MMRTAVFRLCGQEDTGPRRVLAQSVDRIRPAMSLRPANKFSCNLLTRCGAAWDRELADILHALRLQTYHKPVTTKVLLLSTGSGADGLPAIGFRAGQQRCLPAAMHHRTRIG